MLYWIYLLIISLIIFVGLMVFLLPLLMKKTYFSSLNNFGRGVKKTTIDDEIILVYEPTINNRKYIYQYLISQTENEKNLICKIDPEIITIYYFVVAYNENNRIIDVLRVDENITEAGYTKKVELPPTTAYINLLIKKVDGISVPSSDKNQKKPKMVWGILAATLLMGLEAFFVEVCLSNYLGIMYFESLMLDRSSSFLFFFIIGVACLIYFIALNVICHIGKGDSHER